MSPVALLIPLGCFPSIIIVQQNLNVGYTAFLGGRQGHSLGVDPIVWRVCACYVTSDVSDSLRPHGL